MAGNALPDKAGRISGLTLVDKGQTDVIYSVPPIAGATSYSWTLPSGATGSSSSTTISVNFGQNARSGVITVRGVNDIGKGFISFLFIKVYNYSTDLQLKNGWNIISANIIPDSLDMKEVFRPLITANKLIKVQDESGNSLEDLGVFGGWTNNIGNLWLTEGYKVKVNSDCQLLLTGAPVSLPYTIPLKSGWNIVGFPSDSEPDGMTVVQQLINRVMNMDPFEINMSGYSGGIYYFEITGKNWSKSEKVILNQ